MGDLKRHVMKSELKAAKFRLSTIENKLTHIKKYVAKFNATTQSLNLLRARLTILNEILKQFEDVQSRIEKFDEATSPETFWNKRNNFLDQWCEVFASINDVLDHNSFSNSNMDVVQNKSQFDDEDEDDYDEDRPLKENELLVKIQFSGQHDRYNAFETAFKYIMDLVPHYGDTRRFKLLKHCLEDEALRVVESLPDYEQNYTRAWANLETHFKHSRTDVEKYIAEICSLPTMTEPDWRQIKKMMDTLSFNLDYLKTLNFPVHTWDLFLVQNMVDKLDIVTRVKWEVTRVNPTLPSYQDLALFLEEQYLALRNESGKKKKPFRKIQINNERQFPHLLCDNCRNADFCITLE